MNFTLTRPLDKRSGSISIELKGLPESKKEYWTCRKISWQQSDRGYSGKVTVFVKRQADNQTVLKVIPKFEVYYADFPDDSTKSGSGIPDRERVLYRRPCVSTGKLEAEVFKRVSEKAK